MRALFLSAVALALTGLASRVGVVSDLLLAVERKSLDYRVARYRGSWLPEGAAPSEVLIVAVDEASLRELGRYPLWPRSYHGRLIDGLAQAGARTIALDLLLVEPDTLPTAVREARLDEVVERSSIPRDAAVEVLRALGGDQALAESMAAAGNVWLGADPGEDILPLPLLREAARGVGHVAMAPDPDGILRRVPVSAEAADTVLPLAVRTAEAFLGNTSVTGASWRTAVRDGTLPLDPVGPRGSFLTVSYADVLAGRVAPELIRGRMVFVGATAAGLGDVFATPFSQDLPGVEAHATLALQVLEERWPRPPGLLGAVALWLVALPVAALVLGAGPAVAVAGVVGVAALYVVGSFETFAQAGIELPFAGAALAWIVTLVVTAAWRYGAEERGRREMQRAFGRYVAPDVVAAIAERPELLAVGGEAREVTVGFLDIRGFTGISERLEPQTLARFLHAFFDVVEEEIHRRQGMVDKYIGDAVMMVFGAPNELENAPRLACEASLAIFSALKEKAGAWAEFGVEEVRIGVGLETGRAVVGNVGSRRRFDYTVLGDTVNVASRLQDMNKALGTRILAGPGTRAGAGDDLEWVSHGEHQLRGRPGPIAVYELPVGDAHTAEAP